MLQFRSPEFQPGLNVTVRPVEEYADSPDVKPGATVPLVARETGRELGRALIVSVQTFSSMARVPRHLLAFEHVAACRNDPDEVARQLLECYGPDYGPAVTLVFFWYPFA